jgi:hypothetical protein
MCMRGTRKRLGSTDTRRLYIHRCGTTNACALTGVKDEPRLPAPLAPDHWQFWMQISDYHTDDAPYGFTLGTAMTQIAQRGYYLFAGSSKLLRPRNQKQHAGARLKSNEIKEAPGIISRIPGRLATLVQLRQKVTPAR